MSRPEYEWPDDDEFVDGDDDDEPLSIIDLINRDLGEIHGTLGDALFDQISDERRARSYDLITKVCKRFELIEKLRLAASTCAHDLRRSPGGDAYTYEGNTGQVDALKEALEWVEFPDEIYQSEVGK